jgi:hypothetical protein
MRVRLAQIVAVFLLAPGMAAAEAIPVELRNTDQGWLLLRGGQPFFIRGAGGDGPLDKLAEAGANSIRIWGADGAGAILDQAHALGLTVTVGIWLGHERHGFDYRDEAQVAKQLQQAREVVLKYRDHPALLIWGIGNEMEGFESGDDPVIWAAVNAVAAMVKELDPDLPTMTVTAEVGGGRIASVHKHSPAIDIHGINSYGGAPSVAERLRNGGGTKPYVITEFGPVGPWEMPETEWEAPYEQTSTQKADFYRQSYEKAVLEQAGRALGSYAFLWGDKMEGTSTWFGMMLRGGAKLGALDVMTELWSGKPPSDLSPTIEPLAIDAAAELDPGTEIRVSALAADPEGKDVSISWVLRPESGEYMTGGDFRQAPPGVEGAVLDTAGSEATIRMPDEPGPYRLFATAYDPAGNAATANIPLLVKGKTQVRLPVVVYAESLDAMPWVPTGWMGAVDSLSMDGAHAEHVHEGSQAIRMRYTGTYGWVGVAWQNPPNNWGDLDGGFDLTGAAELEVWARGEYGGEKVTFGVGLLEQDRDFPDSAVVKSKTIELTSEWQRYRVSLNGEDLTSLKTGFVVTLQGRRSPVTIYLDSVRFTR